MVQSKLFLKFKNLHHYFLNKSESSDLKKIGLENDQYFYPEQVHGNKVLHILSQKQKKFSGYDGLVTGKPYDLRIKTADCMPIFFYDPEKKLIAAIHAGWKGLYKGIIPEALRLMNKTGNNNRNLFIAIGPHIRKCCYGVNYERIEKFREILDSKCEVGNMRNNKWYLDMDNIALAQLQNYGLDKNNIDISSICTFCNPEYSSYRREGENCGRMLNILGLSS